MTAEIVAQTRAEERADTESSGTPEDILERMDETTSHIESSTNADLDMGSGVDIIEKELANIQAQIDELKQKGLSNLTDEELDKYIALQQRQKELENQQSELIAQQIAEESQKQAANATVIDEKDAAINTLDKEILD